MQQININNFEISNSFLIKIRIGIFRSSAISITYLSSSHILPEIIINRQVYYESNNSKHPYKRKQLIEIIRNKCVAKNNNELKWI